MLAGGLKEAQENANIAIVNTCSVTKSAVSKDAQILQKSRKENPNAKIVLMGCFPVAYRNESEKLGADLVWGVGKLDDLAREIKNKFFSKNLIFHSSQDLISADDRSRYFIKIQDGCEQFCSYCVIPYTRGKLKSRQAREVVEEIKNAVKRGYREIVLSGIHLGLYGKDFSSLLTKEGIKGRFHSEQIKNKIPPRTLLSKERGNLNLVVLLEKILKIKDLGRVRLSSIEITEVSDELINLMKTEKKICKHLHIPLQSGCDKILKRMNRPYDVAFFETKVKKLRKAMPEIALTTDVIVGFSGENEKDFKDTAGFIKKINFSRLHVFPFSAHEMTAAAKMDGKVAPVDKKRRADTLRKLSVGLERNYKNKFRGRELEAIVENSKRGEIKGKTEFYFDVFFKETAGENRAVPGSCVKTKIWK